MQAGTAPSRWAVLRGGEHLWQAPRTHCPAGDATEKKDTVSREVTLTGIMAIAVT